MLIRLTADGGKKYYEAFENCPLNANELSRRGSTTGTRGPSLSFTQPDLIKRLGNTWNEKRIYRFFKGKAFFTIQEAEAMCAALGIAFDTNDYETKAGAPLADTLGHQPDLSEKRFDEREGGKADAVVLDDQQPCNPVALRAEVPDGSIPDPFHSLDFHLKVRVEESVEEIDWSSFNIRELETASAASLSCRLFFSLYQGLCPLSKYNPSTKDDSSSSDTLASEKFLDFHLSTDPLHFHAVDPRPLITAISRLCKYVLTLDRSDRKDLHVHLYLLLPLTWLSGPLPEAIRQGLQRQVFFGCSDRADRDDLSESAITQLHAKAIQVNQSLHSGSALSSLRWASVCGGDDQPVPLTQLFQSTPEAIHLSDGDLDRQSHDCELVGRDALLAAEHRLLFAERFSGAGEGSAEGRLDQRWRRLVEIGLPLVFWWRDPGAPAESARVDQLQAVLKGSWREFCDALKLLALSKIDPTEQNNLAMKGLLANLGIFYEEPLRYIPPKPFSHPRRPLPAAYHHPIHTAP